MINNKLSVKIMRNGGANDGVLTDGRIAVVDEYGQIDGSELRKIDGVLLILCTQGWAKISLSGRNVMAERGDLMICMPDAIVGNLRISDDFRYKCVFASVDYAFRMLPTSIRGWNFRLYFDENPTIRISDEAMETFGMYYGLLRRTLVRAEGRYREMITDGLMQAFVFELRSLLAKHTALKERPVTAGETIFNKFTRLLDNTGQHKQSVKYYAEKLNITPKYLSVVCANVTGRSAQDVIRTYVMKDIERLLSMSAMTIKEVSNELGFPNTSFFGRYVKRCYGCTPVELRRKLNAVEG